MFSADFSTRFQEFQLFLGIQSVGYHQGFYKNIGVRYGMFHFNVLGSVLLYLISKKVSFHQLYFHQKVSDVSKSPYILTPSSINR